MIKLSHKTQHWVDLIIVTVKKEMKVRYKSSVFGYLWSVMNPIAFALVFFIAFKVIMRIQMENYTIFLLSGLFAWQWLANATNVAPYVFISNASIIKKVNFPRNMLVIANIIQDGIHFLLALPVYMVFMFIFGLMPTWHWLYGIPVLFCIQGLMLYGACLVLATVNLFVRDIERMVSIATTFLFYFTPILYPMSMVPEQFRPLINLNPVGPLMVGWRELLLNGRFDGQSVLISFGYSLLVYALGKTVYSKLSWKFAEAL